jgi:hypothetical protein
MAASDVLQRLLNAAGFRIQLLGQAQAGDDAAQLNVPFLALGAGPVNHFMTGLIRAISIAPVGTINTITLPNPALWPGQSFIIMRKLGSAGTVNIATPSGVFVDVNESTFAALTLTAGQGLIFSSDGFDYSFR